MFHCVGLNPRSTPLPDSSVGKPDRISPRTSARISGVRDCQAFFAHISHKGKIRYGDVPGSIGVLEATDKFMPIGEAHCLTWDQNGLAVWTLRIGKEEIADQWVVVDREFRPTE